MDAAERPPGQELTQKQFGALLGVPRSTIHDWIHGNLASPIEHFLCAVERLSPSSRAALFQALCRDCPRIDHPRLAHDQRAVDLLSALLLQKRGLTVIRGADDATRTFVITAIGNSAGKMCPGRSICGIDLHMPNTFVPISGVTYFHMAEGLGMNVNSMKALWRDIENSSAELVFLNDVWRISLNQARMMESLARTRNVFLAGEFGADLVWTRHEAGGTSLINVCADHADRIGLQIRA